MSWNYRVVQKHGELGIHEAYYYRKEDERPHSISINAITPYGETTEALQLIFKMMQKALEKPVLQFEDFNK